MNNIQYCVKRLENDLRIITNNYQIIIGAIQINTVYTLSTSLTAYGMAYPKSLIFIWKGYIEKFDGKGILILSSKTLVYLRKGPLVKTCALRWEGQCTETRVKHHVWHTSNNKQTRSYFLNAYDLKHGLKVVDLICSQI